LIQKWGSCWGCAEEQRQFYERAKTITKYKRLKRKLAANDAAAAAAAAAGAGANAAPALFQTAPKTAAVVRRSPSLSALACSCAPGVCVWHVHACVLCVCESVFSDHKRNGTNKLRLMLLLLLVVVLLLGQKTGGESFYDKVHAIVGIGFVGARSCGVSCVVCRVCATPLTRLRGGLGVMGGTDLQRTCGRPGQRGARGVLPPAVPPEGQRARR
jgi:hypothetical protein